MTSTTVEHERLTTFAYRATRATGAEERGTIDAPSREAALARLAERELYPFEITARRERSASGPRGARLSAGDLAVGLRVLATLLDAGLPLHRAVLVFEELAPPAWRAALPHVRSSITEGQGLAAALSSAPLRIPSAVLGMIRAGEAGGRLADAVRTAADFSERGAAVSSAVRSALAYPMLLCVVGGIAIALLTGVVIPRFAGILADLGQGLPPSTRIVLAVAESVRTRAPLAGVVLGIGAVAFAAWVATADGRARWHAWLLGLPIVGAVRWSSASGRFCAALASLLESGLPLAPAVTHAAHAAADLAVERRVLAGRESIVAGQRIADALQATDALPGATIRLIRAGEESGQLAPMLTYASRIESDRAQRTLATAVRLLEPTLIVAFAGLVTLVAAALLQAIYSIRPAA